MKRNVGMLKDIYDIRRVKCGLPLGIDGEYFVAADGEFGDDKSPDIIDYNEPPSDQPGLWCHWRIENNHIVWSGQPKFSDFRSWLEYLIDNFFIPWRYKLNGSISYQFKFPFGDFPNGVMVVKNNDITIIRDGDPLPKVAQMLLNDPDFIGSQT